MKGAFAGKTMYVIPYLMAPPGSPLEKYAAGVEITDNRTVCLHMIRMARVGIDLINNLAEPDHFVRAVHVTGDLPNLGQGTPEDKRYFVTVADERTILHFGSSYGGNALLGKIVTPCGRLPTTAGAHGSSCPSSSCCSASRTRRPARNGTSAAASRAPRARPTSP